MKKIFLILCLSILFCVNSFSQNANSPEEQFFLDFTVHQMATQNRLTHLQYKSNLKKLGNEVMDGKISGKLSYNTDVNMKTLSGTVHLTWENFSDEDGWIFNGQIIATANMKGTGTLKGQITVSGIYDGIVVFDNVDIENSVASAGTYGVQLKNGPFVEIPYTMYFQAMGEDYYMMSEE